MEAWLATRPRPGGVPTAEDSSAASSLLSVPVDRVTDGLLEGPKREPLSWAGIDACEILMHELVQPELPEDVDVEAYLQAIGSFAAFLGERGLIPAREHEQLQAEFGDWAARLLPLWKLSSLDDDDA